MGIGVLWVLALWMIVGLSCVCGCMMWTPGTQSAASMRTAKTITWDAEDNFGLTVTGVQTDELTIAGGLIALQENPETGALEIDAGKSALSYFLHSNPRADDAREASIVYAGESTKQVTEAMTAIRDLTQAIAAVLPAIVSRPEPPADGGEGGDDGG
jgi:hypothetical protein